MKLELSQVIDRPPAVVFRFIVVDHVRNHPRWDPNMQLEQVSDGPNGVGTIIKRINSHSGAPVEGTMEIVEFEPNRAFGMIVHDGPVEMVAWATYEAESDDRTTLTLNVEFLGMDESIAGMLTSEMDQVAQTIKQFIESEV